MFGQVFSLLTAFLLLVLGACVFAQSPIIAYRDTDYGNLSNDNPATYYFNATYDTVQNPDYFSQKGIYPRHSLVWKRISKPHDNVKKGGGYDKLFRDEFIGTRAVPNYTLHLIGGGYDFRRMSEWYQVHKTPYPYFWGTMTILAGEIGNEALESSNTKDIGPHDHIADLYFFDTAGKILFANDTVAQFLTDELQLPGFSTSWSKVFRRCYAYNMIEVQLSFD